MSKITVGGGVRTFDFASPRVEDVDLIDIARSLGRVNRWLGHSTHTISVAEHCVLVSRILETINPALAMQGLLHDASEAYCADVPSQLKAMPEMAGYRQIEDRILATILEAFGEPSVLHPAVHVVDKRISANEALALFRIAPEWVGTKGREPYNLKAIGLSIASWPPDVAKDMYLRRFMEIAGYRGRAHGVVA